MVRCKFELTEITTYVGGSQKFVFTARYDTSIPEDNRFMKETPDGKIEMRVNNPAAQKLFEIGKHYYFDATPVPST